MNMPTPSVETYVLDQDRRGRRYAFDDLDRGGITEGAYHSLGRTRDGLGACGGTPVGPIQFNVAQRRCALDHIGRIGLGGRAPANTRRLPRRLMLGNQIAPIAVEGQAGVYGPDMPDR